VTTVILGAPPLELAALLTRRRVLGLDAHDEVWEGVYHLAPHAHSDHGIVELEVGVALRRHGRAVGLVATAAFNLGEPADYRVPDGGLHRQRPAVLYVPTAALVVEVLSPGDETMGKRAFYAAHGVEELLVADPAAQTLRLWRLEGPEHAEMTRSALLGVTLEELANEIDWP